MMMVITFLLSIVMTIDYRLNHFMQMIAQTIPCDTGPARTSRHHLQGRPPLDEFNDQESPLNDQTLPWDNAQFPHAWLAYEEQQQQRRHPNNTTKLIPKPPYMILLTEYGWNHPDPKHGLTFARSIRSTEYLQAIVNHPYFHPTAYHEIMITQTRTVDPNTKYYLFLDIETCYETNYPHYRKSYSGNCDRTGHRSYYSYTYIKHRRPPTAACYNLDHPHCHYIPTEINTNPIFTDSNRKQNKLVVLDCRGNGQNAMFRNGASGNSTSMVLVSLSSTVKQLNSQIDQGLPPPSIQKIQYSTITTATSTSTSSISQYDQEMKCDCEMFLKTTNETASIYDTDVLMSPSRKYFLSLSGNYQRHPVRQELAKLDTVRSTMSSLDLVATTSTPQEQQQEQPLVLITESKELYQSTNGLSYSELLLSSQYVAVPRGDNLFSYRFTEVLSSGAIPVLIHNTEWVLPFRPEIVDWNRCVIRIAADQIHTTIARLKNISSNEECQRRQYCYHIYETYMRNSSTIIQGILDGIQAVAAE